MVSGQSRTALTLWLSAASLASALVPFSSGAAQYESIEVFRSAAGSDAVEGFVATVVANDTGTKTLTLNTSLPDIEASDLPRVRPVDSTFKWSRDNGSVVTLVTAVSTNELTVASVGPDENLGFGFRRLAPTGAPSSRRPRSAARS